MLNNVSS
ncbi:hypothetical protein EC900039_3834A, partial [Escherichia coli 90.0039]